MVKKIYKDMLRDLGLKSRDVHIYVGETEYEEMGGGCSWHNHVVAKIPEVIRTGHVVSAKDIPGNGTDPWHFSAAGYRRFGKRYAEVVLDVMRNPEAKSKNWGVDERLTGGVSALTGKLFAIVNETEWKAFYGSGGENLGYGSFKEAFDESNGGYLFKIAKVGKGSGLKLITPDGEVYQTADGAGYLNSQDAGGDCCFVNNLNKQRGYAIPDGAVWDLQYVEGKGWALKNNGTGRYLKDPSHPAMFDEPTYFTFCTLKEVATGIQTMTVEKPQSDAVYTLDGRRIGNSPEQSQSLKPGIYIKGGKKFIVK